MMQPKKLDLTMGPTDVTDHGGLYDERQGGIWDM
jgi:hypothetical protein